MTPEQKLLNRIRNGLGAMIFLTTLLLIQGCVSCVAVIGIPLT